MADPSQRTNSCWVKLSNELHGLVAEVNSVRDLMNERDRRYGEVSTAKEEAVKVALANAEKAVAVSERNAEKWRDSANEWRQAMTDRERNFLPRNIGYIIGALTVITLIVSLLDRIAK